MTHLRGSAFTFAVFWCFISVTSQYFEPKIGLSVNLTLSAFYDTFYTTQCGEYTYFAVSFPYPCRDLIISVKPIHGEPDVYASKANVDGDPYPTKEKLTWAAYADDYYTLIIDRYDPESSPGYYYIGIYGDCSQQNNAAVYQIQAFPSIDNAVSLYNTDILEFPPLGINKNIAANKYAFFRFCLPECANVKIVLENCIDNSVCPEAYSFPELLVSRNKLLPSLKDYSYKLASSDRRHIWVNHTDPSGRDSNGFIQGSYYVGVFGYCTPQQYVLNNATDGPCMYAKNTKFNVTVKVYPIAGSSKYGECPEESQALMLPTPPSYPLIESGVPVSGTVACTTNGPQMYTYYTFAVPHPCNDLKILITSGSSSLNLDVAEVAVGKYPNTVPTFDNIQWTSYDHGLQNITISAFDPAFNGGYVCGPDGASECLLYIGVTGYCAASNSTHVDFTLTATLAPLANNILRVPQVNQIVGANKANQYQFCVDSRTDITAQLKSFTSACDCPDSYANLEVAVSRTRRDAGMQDLAWKLERSDTAGLVKLLDSDHNTRPGTYYMNVIGHCNNAASCKESECTCSPCSNLPASSYSLYVGTSTDFAGGKNEAATLGSCSVAGTVGGTNGKCRNTCPVVVVADTSYYNFIINNGARAGIAIAAFFGALSFCGCTLYYYRQYLTCTSNSRDDGFQVRRRDSRVPLFEMTSQNTMKI